MPHSFREMTTLIYLDNGATTFPKPECVYDAVDTFSRTAAVNAGRGAYKAARSATAMIRDVKQQLLSLCDAKGQAEVVLTPSSTIALNQIIHGFKWESGMTAYVSPYEHNAVLRPLELLRKRTGIQVIELPLAEDLSIDLAETERMFKETPPAFVALTAVSNVTGYVLPAREVFLLAKEYGAFTLLDASQALGLVKLRFAQTMADTMVFAGHKTLYATFGIAGFYVKNGVDLEEYIVGGNGTKSLSLDMPAYMPDKMESASANTVAIAGLQASLNWLKTISPWKIEHELMEYLIPQLKEIPGLKLYGAPSPDRQVGVISINLDCFRANEVGAILDNQWDVAVRAGHHCAALIHRHLKNKEHDGTVRISLSVFTTKEDLDVLIAGLKSIDREMLKGISADVLRGNC